MLTPAFAAPAAATLPLFLPQAPPDKSLPRTGSGVSGLFHAATLLAQLLGQGRALDNRALRFAMEAAFGGTDAEGAWVWRRRRRALWVSKSDKLIEDAERDWTAIGGYRSDLVPLSRFRQGAAIALDEGILFTTYATLRTQAKSLPRTGSGGDKPSRVQQIIDWLGRDPGSGPGQAPGSGPGQAPGSGPGQAPGSEAGQVLMASSYSTKPMPCQRRRRQE
jgi:P-loop containing NTP hydrolase pore-1